MATTFASTGFGRCRAVALAGLCALSVLSCDGQHTAGSAARSTTGRTSTTRTAGTAAPGPAAKGPGTPTVDHTLMDAGWGLPYGTVRLPAGWAFHGGVVHGENGCFAMGDSPMWSAESADKSYGVDVLPLLKTGFTSDANLLRQMQQSHCPMLRSSSATDYLTQYVLPHLHAAGSMRVVARSVEPRLEPMADQIRQMSARTEQVGNTQYSQRHTTVTTGRVLVQFQEGGRTLNEVASTVFACTETRMMMPMTGRTEMLDCSAPITIVGHGPEDGTPFTNEAVDAHSKDPAFFSMTQSEAWTQRFNQKAAQAQQQQQQQAQQILSQSQQNMRNQQAQFEAGQARHREQQQGYDQQNAAWKARQQAQDQSHQAFIHSLSDTNVYTNTQTGQQYEMSNQYSNTYVNQNGQVGLQTNSATSPGVDWTLLQPKY